MAVKNPTRKHPAEVKGKNLSRNGGLQPLVEGKHSIVRDGKKQELRGGGGGLFEAHGRNVQNDLTRLAGSDSLDLVRAPEERSNRPRSAPRAENRQFHCAFDGGYHAELMKPVATVLTLVCLVALNASGREGLCSRESAYDQGVCLYDRGRYAEAIEILDGVVAVERVGQQRVKAMYFKGRSLMRLKRWDEAQRLWIDLFSISPAFYRLWNCDYLLGVCRAKGQ